jgi:hypothetical protein
MMKKIIISALMLLALGGLRAQDSEIQTLFSGSTRVSGFGGPMMSFTIINGHFAHMMGGGGAVLLGNFFIGGYGEGLTNAIELEGSPYDLEFGHGGFWTGYSFMSNKSLHPALSAQIGWGGVAERQDYTTVGTPDNVFVFNPAVELEMNFTRFFRLGVGLHYRIVTGASRILSNAELSGPGASLIFQFGWF